MPFLGFPHVAVEIATAVERLVVIHQFLHEEEACKVFYIKVLPQFTALLVAVDEGVEPLHLRGKKIGLRGREHLWCLVSEDDRVSVPLRDGDMRV